MRWLAESAYPDAPRRPCTSEHRKADQRLQRIRQRFRRSQGSPVQAVISTIKAIERRRLHETVRELLEDERLLDYVYAVLPGWGMHRMGKQAAKVGEFDDMVRSLRRMGPRLEKLRLLNITSLPESEVPSIIKQLWQLVKDIKVSTSETQIVAGSKALHHVHHCGAPSASRSGGSRDDGAGRDLVVSSGPGEGHW